jgi:pectate lyase
MARSAVECPELSTVILSVAAAVIMAWASPTVAQVSNPAYVEGYGKDATGGAGQIVYTVDDPSPGFGASTPSNPLNHGTFEGALFQVWRGNILQDIHIVFAVSSFSMNQGGVYIGRNVTIDGCENGQNGVTFDMGGVGDVRGSPSQPPSKMGFALFEGSSNVIIRCLNFIGYGWGGIEYMNGQPNPAAMPQTNAIWLEVGLNTPGGVIENILIDRCTFTRISNKAIDITTGGGLTGRTRNVTVQRSLFHDNARVSHIKYANGTDTVREKISYHHNVFVHNAERQPQIVDTVGPFDYVNNIVYANTGDVLADSSGEAVDTYGIRVWNTSGYGQIGRGGAAYDPYYGQATINIEGNAFLGTGGSVLLLVDSDIPGDPAPAGISAIYVSADNYFQGAQNRPELRRLTRYDSQHDYISSNPSIPLNTQNSIPTQYQVATRTAVTNMASQMLPYIGAPNRTALDTQRINEVASRLPSSGSSLPVAPSNLTVR